MNRLTESYNYLMAAWYGESPTCKLSEAAKRVLDPSCYRYTHMGRAALALRGITMSVPYVNTVSDYVNNFLKTRGYETELANAPRYFDADYRIFEDKAAVKQELARVHNAICRDGKTKHKPLSRFAKAIQTASGPLPEHTTETLLHLGVPLQVTTAWAQGKRPTMEDEHLAKSFKVHNLDACVFGVFDGHSGDEAAKFVKSNLVKVLKLYLERESKLNKKAIMNALTLACLDLDNRFTGTSGTCASIALFLMGKIWVANVGDSRTVLDNEGHTQQFSRDAKPGLEPYATEIEARGGVIEHPKGRPSCCRINRGLNIARTIGDHGVLGQQGFGCVSARPEIKCKRFDEIGPNSRLIIGCDGLWDVATTREVVKANKSAPELVRAALKAGSTDNVTAMVIKLC